MISAFKVICIDPNCPKYNELEIVKNRTVILNHVKRLKRDEIIDILKVHDVIMNFSYLTDITLVNILTDCCYAHHARRLLEDKTQ